MIWFNSWFHGSRRPRNDEEGEHFRFNVVTPGSIPSPPTEQDAGNTTRKVIIAGLISGLLPGVGQLQLGKKLQGFVFLLLFVLLLLLWWPVRVAFYWPGLVALVLCTLVLCISSGSAVVITYKQPRISRWWLIMTVLVGVLAAIAQVNWMARMSGFVPCLMPSRSMEKTIMANETLLGDAWYYTKATPARGDVILFRKNDAVIVKRVAAVAGDTIQGRDGVIFLNDKEIDEPYSQRMSTPGDPAFPQFRNFGPVYVPPGKLFVLGDNRDNSYDSRTKEYGLVDVASVFGKPLYITRSPDSSRVGRTIK